MPVNDTTTNQGYQKPNIANTLADDVGRLRSALDAIDTDMASKAPSAGPTFTGVTTVGAGSAAAPSLTFTGATSDTGFYSPGADQVAISTGGSQRATFDSSGRLLAGTTTAINYAGIFPGFQLATNTSSLRGDVNAYFAADNVGASFVVAKSRSGTIGTHLYPVSGDTLGLFAFAGSNEASNRFDSGAYVSGAAAETWSATGRGTNILFATTTVGSTNLLERARITSDGYLRLAATNSLGIQFNGNTAAASALDDYEEGTWTPAFSFGTSGSVTYSSQLGEYVKIGNTVTARGLITLSAVSAPTGNTTITGLPFTSGSRTSNVSAGYIGIARSFASAGLPLAIYNNNNSTSIIITKNDTNATVAQLQGSDLTAATAFYFSVTYAV